MSQDNLKDIDFIKISISEHIIQIIISIISIKNPCTKYKYKKSKYTTFVINTFKKNNFGKYEFDYTGYKNNFNSFVEFINCHVKSVNLIEIFINTNNFNNHSILFDFLHIKFFIDVRIILGRDFNYPIDLSNYNNVKTIYLRGKSKKNSLYFPKNLINLYLSRYHHPDAILPQVKNLYLHKSYNKKIILDNTNIMNVIFGEGFNNFASLNASAIKSLEFKNKCNCMLKQIPYSIEIIKINCWKINSELDYLPNSIKELEIKSNRFNNNLDNLHNSIIKLTLDISDKYSNSLSNLPNSIEELTILDNLIFNINKLPNSLNKLNIINSFCLQNLLIKNELDKKLNELLNFFDNKNLRPKLIINK